MYIYIFLISVLAKLIISPINYKLNLKNDFDQNLQIIDNLIIYIPDLIIITLIIFFFLEKNKINKVKLYYFFLFFILLNVSSNIQNDKNIILGLISIFKLLSPLMIFFVLNYKVDQLKQNKIVKLNYFLLVFIIILFIYGLINFDPMYKAKVEKLPSYFGNLHNSSYIILSSLFLFHLLNLYEQNKIIRLFYFIYILIVFWMLIYGWTVRTSVLSLFVFYTLIFLSTKNEKSIIFNFIFILFLSLFFLIISLNFNFLSLDEFDFITSGRISMYAEKFDTIKSFTISQIILGTGYGSDLIVSEIWWWGERGSHNDFLTFFIENGVIFLLLYVALLKDIYIMLKNNTQKILFLSIIFTSCVSNGFLTRSISLYLIIFIIICLKNYNLKNNTKMS